MNHAPHHRYRWSDNQLQWWRFIFAHDGTFKHFAIELSSRCSDRENYHCRFRITIWRWTLIVLLPDIIKPERRLILPKDMKYKEYYLEIEREYGFSLSGNYLQILYGRQTDDSSDEHRKGIFLPFADWRFHSLSYFTDEGKRFVTLTGREENNHYTEMAQIVPKVTFRLLDFDYESIICTTFITMYTHKFGTGWFKWLSLFVPDRHRKGLDLRFDKEIGRRKGSYKGGTLAHGIDMIDKNELHESAMKRYCIENEMTFLGVLNGKSRSKDSDSKDIIGGATGGSESNPKHPENK